MCRKWLSTVIGFMIMICGVAQQPGPYVLTLEEFLAQVNKHHPVAKQAKIQVDKADATLLSARGNFDPMIGLAADRKTFDGTNYYYYTNPALTIPLPIGNIKTGVENNGGTYAATEITKGRSSYAGLELPVARGLLLDKRRAALQQAKILRTQSEQERRVMINNLLLDASNAYWQWAGSHRLYKIYSKFTEIAGNRLKLVSLSFKNGDRALMDTVEAYTQLQNYQLMQSSALLELNNAQLEISSFLWTRNVEPVELPANHIPDSLDFTRIDLPGIDDLLASSARSNPWLAFYDQKIRLLEVDRRLKFQELLPYVAVSANLLSKDYYSFKNAGMNYLQNNYKWGIDFKIPLFLREARGNYKKARLYLQETKLELVYKRQQTDIKIRSYFNELLTLKQQLETASNMYKNYTFLLQNETLKFSQGESSLFLVNSRETKLVEAAEKQIELLLKFNKTRYKIEWAAGLLASP